MYALGKKKQQLLLADDADKTFAHTLTSRSSVGVLGGERERQRVEGCSSAAAAAATETVLISVIPRNPGPGRPLQSELELDCRGGSGERRTRGLCLQGCVVLHDDDGS